MGFAEIFSTNSKSRYPDGSFIVSVTFPSTLAFWTPTAGITQTLVTAVATINECQTLFSGEAGDRQSEPLRQQRSTTNPHMMYFVFEFPVENRTPLQ